MSVQATVIFQRRRLKDWGRTTWWISQWSINDRGKVKNDHMHGPFRTKAEAEAFTVVFELGEPEVPF